MTANADNNQKQVDFTGTYIRGCITIRQEGNAIIAPPPNRLSFHAVKKPATADIFLNIACTGEPAAQNYCFISVTPYSVTFVLVVTIDCAQHALAPDIDFIPVCGAVTQRRGLGGMVCKLKFGRLFTPYLLRKQRVAATTGFLLVFGLHAFNLHAELLFRSFVPSDGQPHWSSLKKYDNPSDTFYTPDAAGGNEAPAEEVRIFLSGDITRADLESAAVMERLLKSGKQKLSGNVLWLTSKGGDIDTGMELGRLLRRLGIFTVVDKDDQCLSACVFVFMGGERRSVAGQLGIHRPYFPYTDDVPDRQARFRHLQQTLKSFIAEMDFPDSLYEAVMLVPPESMQMIAPADLKKFYLEGISPSTEDRIDAAAARRLGLTMYEFLKRKAMAPACDFFAAGEGRCAGRVREAAAGDDTADKQVNAQTNTAEQAGRAESNRRPVRAKKPPDSGLRGPT